MYCAREDKKIVDSFKAVFSAWHQEYSGKLSRFHEDPDNQQRTSQREGGPGRVADEMK